MGNKTNHFVYMLRCQDGTLYTGYTNDIERRLQMHEAGKGAKYTRGRGPFQLVYKQEFATKREALQMEYKIKQLDRHKKTRLIITYQEGQDQSEDTN